jgi:DeoR family glycerol-3-phosphate regulon repressor
VKSSLRHDEIVKLVNNQGFVSTEDLVEQFKVSPQTIRRDLNDLASQNRIKRNHGGATLFSSSENTAYQTRKVLALQEKSLIAQAIVKHIPDGSTLFLDIGTTPEAIARALLESHSELNIVTNNIHVATLLMRKTGFKVIIAGGELRSIDGGVTGEATLDLISQFRLDFGILGISGIDDDGSLLDFDYHEVRVKRAIIENSRQVFLGVDHTKFGRSAMVKLGNLSEMDLVISNQLPPKTIQSVIKQNSIPFEIAAQ